MQTEGESQMMLDRADMRFCIEGDSRCYYVVDKVLYRRVAKYAYRQQADSIAAYNKARDDMISRNIKEGYE
jgi:hypothetical protein